MHKTHFYFLSFILWTIPIISYGQDTNQQSSEVVIVDNEYYPSAENSPGFARQATPLRNTLSAQFGIADPWFGVCYERLINPYWGFDVAIGMMGAAIGTKVYYPKLSPGKISFYAGITESTALLIGRRHYIPLGFSYLAKRGFRLNLDLGPQIFLDKTEENQFGLSLKIGKAF